MWTPPFVIIEDRRDLVVARERLGNGRSAAQRVYLAGWACWMEIFEEVAR
jgi:hypothetical protein